MPARFLADEQFDFAINNALRRLGHDVKHARQYSSDKRGDGMSDAMILAIAQQENRIILTQNAKDFRALATDQAWHQGIVILRATMAYDAVQIASEIDEIVKSYNRCVLTGRIEIVPRDVVGTPKRKRRKPKR